MAPNFFLPLKETIYIYFYIFSRATLNKTFTAKNDGILPRTPKVRPKSEIYTPKRDDEHPHPFCMQSLSPPPRELISVLGEVTSRGRVW